MLVPRYILLCLLCSIWNVAKLFLNFLENFRPVLLINDLLTETRVNSKLNVYRSNLAASKTVKFVLGLYL